MDTSMIEGYAEMSAEQKVAALEALDIPAAPDLTGYVKKELLDKASSEAASFKKQLRERMSAEEAAEADRQQKRQELDDRYAELEAKYNQLQRQNVISEYKSKLVSTGYDEKLAAKTAKAMAEGDMQTVLQCHADFVAARDKQMRAEALKGMSGPKGGDGEDAKAPEIELAQALGKAKAAAGSATGDILARYTLK